MTYPKIRTLVTPESKNRLLAVPWVPVVNLTANGDTVGVINLDMHVVCATRHMGPLSTRYGMLVVTTGNVFTRVGYVTFENRYFIKTKKACPRYVSNQGSGGFESSVLTVGPRVDVC